MYVSCTFMYVCMYVCMYACMHECLNAYLNMYVQDTYTYEKLYVLCIHTRSYASMALA